MLVNLSANHFINLFILPETWENFHTQVHPWGHRVLRAFQWSSWWATLEESRCLKWFAPKSEDEKLWKGTRDVYLYRSRIYSPDRDLQPAPCSLLSPLLSVASTARWQPSHFPGHRSPLGHTHTHTIRVQNWSPHTKWPYDLTYPFVRVFVRLQGAHSKLHHPTLPNQIHDNKRSQRQQINKVHQLDTSNRITF